MSSLDEYLKKAGLDSSTKSNLDSYLEKARPTERTPAFQKKSVLLPKEKKSALSKIGGAVKDVVKETVSSAVTIPARIPQAIAMVAGANEEDIDRVSSKLSGGLIAPVPRNAGDVYKDVGRVVETGAFAIPGSTAVKLGVGGAVSGLGVSMREGNPILSKDTALNVGVGGAFGYGLGKVIPKILPKFSNPNALSKTDEIEIAPEFKGEKKSPVVETLEPTHKPVVKTEVQTEARVPVRGEVPAVEPKRMFNLGEAGRKWGEMGYTINQLPKLAARLPQAERYTMEEIVSAVGRLKPKGEVSKTSIFNEKPYVGVQDTTNKPMMIEAKRTPLSPEEITPPTQPVQQVPQQVANQSTETTNAQQVLKKLDEQDTVEDIVERQTNREQERVALSGGLDEMEDVVFRGAEPRAGSNKSAYLRVLQAEAQRLAEQGDNRLMKKLATSPVGINIEREAGQSLQSLVINSKNNIARIIDDLKVRMLESKVPSGVKDAVAYQRREVKKLKDELVELTKGQLTKDDISEVISSIICK